jgi:hypothetical protein
MLTAMWRSALALLVSFASACSTGGNGQNPPPEYAMMQSGGDVIQTSVDGSRIFGPNIMLERSGDGIRGNGPMGVVDLRKDGPTTLRGMIGNGATELHLEPLEEDGFVMRGMFSAVLSKIEVRADRIEGQLGRCQYNLRRDASSELRVAYNGRRLCSRDSFQPATITIAPSIAAMDPIDRAAIVAILLGR